MTYADGVHPADNITIDCRALLKRHRDARRWSQERLAEKAEMDHSLVSRLESGQRAFTREALDELIVGLNLTADDADALLIAAGFVPTRRGSMVADEPGVVQVYMLLHDPTVAEGVKEAVRAQLTSLIVLASNTARVHPGTGASLGLPPNGAAMGGK